MVSLGNPFKHKDEISPEQAEGAVAAEAEVQGADVQQFDENASPEESHAKSPRPRRRCVRAER